MPYKFKREDAFNFAQSNGFQFKIVGNEMHFATCPKCQGGSHNDEDTFSINLGSGAFKCLRSSCGYQGHFVELARDYDFGLEIELPRIYKELKQPKKEIESNSYAIKYMESRGIPSWVTKRYEITTRNDNESVIVFPFYNDKGKLEFIKYRNTKHKKGDKQPKEYCEKDTMPILFGMKQVPLVEDTLIICEGQMDSLSCVASGFDNAVSVPTGATGFTWLMPCRDFIERFSTIIVFGDWENGKMTLLDTLKARISTATIKAVRKQDYLGEKDANDILRNYGTQAVRKAIENAEVPKLENVKDLSSVEPIDINALDKIKTGIDAIDRVIGGICMGQVLLLTGKRGEGKSSLLSQFVANALDQNERVFAYSGELSNQHFRTWLDFQLAGKKHIIESQNEYGDATYKLDDDVAKQIGEWYRGRCYVYDSDYIDDGDELGGLLETIERVIRQYGCRLICVDNLMTAMEIVTNQDNLYLAQSNFVGKLKKLAMKYQVGIILVAHPRKAMGDLSNDDVSGSSDITNKVDTVLAFARASEEDEFDCYVQVLKNRLYGTLRNSGKDSAIKLNYSPNSRRIYDYKEEYIPKVYGWEKLPSIEEFDDVDFFGEELPF